MLQIKKRWPVLTALAALLAYSANNYQIAGLEHLRIEPRSGGSSNPSQEQFNSAYNDSLSWDPLSREAGAGLGAIADWNAKQPWGSGPTPNATAWNNALSLGEKVALWQDKLQAASKATADGNRSRTSNLTASPLFADPIPLPAELGAALGMPSNHFVATTTPALPAVDIPSSVIPKVEVPRAPFGLDSSMAETAKRIRVGSFNLQSLGPTKLAKPHVSEMLVRILRQFDVIALQSVQSSRDDILPILTERLNQSGRSYDYVIGPRVGRGDAIEQFAFVFETSRVETDRYQLYTIEDPEDLITYDPLVAWFRAKEVPADRAFTFSLVNVHVLGDLNAGEHSLLPSIIQAVQSDGRQEDDWIILGDVGCGPQDLPVDRNSVRFAFTDVPTDVTGERARSVVLFSTAGTIEYTGRSGVFDFLRKFNLSLERALEVSDQLPVWAEFSAVEGGEPGRIAP